MTTSSGSEQPSCPQRGALETVFGVRAGASHPRLPVGLAVLGLLSNASVGPPGLLPAVGTGPWQTSLGLRRPVSDQGASQTGRHDPGQRAFDDPAAGSRTNPEVSFGRLTVLIVRFRWRLAQVAWQGRTGSLSHVCRSASGLVGHEADVSASLMPLSVENAKRTVSTNLHLPGAGPHPHVSEPVLATVARALGLADTERDYLFALAGLALSACSVAARPARSAPVPVHRIPKPPPDRWLLHHYGSPDTLITRPRRRGRRRAP
jgi:hypothetical protein